MSKATRLSFNGRHAHGYLYARWMPVPVCWPDAYGHCGCGRNHSGHEIGKAPLISTALYSQGGVGQREVETWWTKWPQANVGILIHPSKLFIIDVDSESARQEVQRLGLPPTPYVSSRPGRGHYYCQGAQNLSGRAIKRGQSQKIDILVEGLIIVPPSRHASGRYYEWEVHPSRQPLQAPPSWAVNWLTSATNSARVQKVSIPEDLPNIELSDLRVSPRIKRLIQTGEDPTRYPSRSEALFAVILKLLSAGYSDTEIAAILLDPAHLIGEKAQEKGRDWLASEIRRAKIKVKANDQTSQTHAEEPKATTTPWSCSIDLLAEPIPEIKWRMDRLIPHESLTLFAGREGTMKTWLAMKWARAIAEGKTWLGRPCEQSRVLYVDAEMPRSLFLARLKAIGASRNLNVWHHQDENFPTKLDDPRLLEAAKAHDVIFFDTLKRFMEGLEENSSSDMAKITSKLRKLAQWGASVIAIHHATKDSERSGYRGSTELGASVDIVLLVEKKTIENEETLHLSAPKTRYAEGPKLLLDVKRTPSCPMFSDLSYQAQKAEAAKEEAKLRTLAKVMNDLSQQLGHEPNQSVLVGHLQTHGFGSRNTILRWLQQGEDKYWKSVPHGNTRLYRPLSHYPSVQPLKGGNNLDKDKSSVQSVQGAKGPGQMDKARQGKIVRKPTAEQKEVIDLVG